MLRNSCILVLCAVIIHVCSSRHSSRRQSDAEVAKSREELRKALNELKEFYPNANDKYELEQLSKMIKTADKKTIRVAKQYLQYIKYLINKKKEEKNENLNTNRNRRFLSWIKNIFSPSSSSSTPTRPTTIKTTSTTPPNTTPYVPRATTEWTERVADMNLTETLNKLIDVLYKLNENIKNANNDTQGFYVVKVPVSVTNLNKNNIVPFTRTKRELETQTAAIVETAKTNETEKMNFNVNYNNTKQLEDSRSELQDVVTVPVAVENVKRKRNKRDVSSPMIDLIINKVSLNKTEDLQNETTSLDSVVTNVTSDLLNRANTRRNFSPQNNIKAKLFLHLYDIFDEMKLKLEPVLRIKDEYSSNVAFKVGYISANLDTLGSNLARLRDDMEENAHAWSDSKVLELFDVLKIHHNVVVKLLDSLMLYLHVKPKYSLD